MLQAVSRIVSGKALVAGSCNTSTTRKRVGFKSASLLLTLLLFFAAPLVAQEKALLQPPNSKELKKATKFARMREVARFIN